MQKHNSHATKIVRSSLESNWKTYDENNARDLIDCLRNERLRLERMTNKQFQSDSVEEKKSNDDYTKAQLRSRIDTSKTQHQNPSCLADSNTAEKGPGEDDFKEKLAGSATTLFQAGFDTFFTMIYWSMIYFAVYPETQEKVHEEIVSMISHDEQPSFREHASKCHYTVAWIYELMRHVSPLPLLLPHATTQQVELENCLLPPHLTVFFNVYQVHFDPKLWDNPQEFNPDRFLDKDTQAFKQNIAGNVLSWGIGKRLCPGKDLSKHEMFIFICTIVRRLKIKPSRPGIEPTLPWPMELGISLKPKPFKIKIEER